MTTSSTIQPFHLDAAGVLGPVFERLLAFADLNRVHARAAADRSEQPFSQRALDALDVRLDVEDSALAQIPALGPLVVMANHPFGGIDGLGLIALLQRRRSDLKILANHLLRRIPELRDVAIFVDPFGGETAAQRNRTAMREALKWVRGGGALAMFPAGEVSSLHISTRSVTDPTWSRHAAALVRLSGAAVLPIFFSGCNSGLFQCAGMLWPRLRTALLPRELLRRRGTRLAAQIGKVLPARKLREFDNDAALAAYLRVRTYLLGARTERTLAGGRVRDARVEQPIVSAFPADEIAIEIAQLPAERKLAVSGHFQVVYASAGEIPTTLREIGRLREMTFRMVGEGTGRALDIDRFDETYLHLLVWNEESREVVGAYRLGLTDRILETAGKDGLYTSTLFHFRDELLSQLSPAIELGRSFVRPEYQKEYAPLMLLWKGIALFVARHPQYRRLFGPVSISNRYRSLTRQLLVEFLKHNTGSDDLHKMVTPRHPPKFGPGRNWEARLAGTIVRSIEGIDDLIGEIESDRLGMPVLLRQYLKLNAKLLGFNVDPDFGDVLDGLMLVDLTQVERAVLVRYMGREAAAGFMQHHGRVL